MLRKLVVLGVAASFTVIGCSEAPTTPQIVPQLATTTTTSPISGTITHPCTGEPIQYEGTAHISTSTKTKGDITSVRVSAHTANTHGVGLTTGTRYVLVEGAKQTHELSASPPFPTSGQVFVRDRWQSQGGADNFWGTTRYTITFDGVNTTTDIQQMETDCKG